MEQIIQLNQSNIAKEHICCGFSDVKCKEGYELKKRWLSNEFEKGYLFRRIDARAKVFIEYGPRIVLDAYLCSKLSRYWLFLGFRSVQRSWICKRAS